MRYNSEAEAVLAEHFTTAGAMGVRIGGEVTYDCGVVALFWHMFSTIEHELLYGTGFHVYALLAGVVLCVLSSVLVLGWLGWRLFRQSAPLLAGLGFALLVLNFIWACYLVWVGGFSLLLYIWAKQAQA